MEFNRFARRFNESCTRGIQTSPGETRGVGRAKGFVTKHSRPGICLEAVGGTKHAQGVRFWFQCTPSIGHLCRLIVGFCDDLWLRCSTAEVIDHVRDGMGLFEFNGHIVPCHEKAKHLVFLYFEGPAIPVCTNQSPTMNVFEICLNRLR